MADADDRESHVTLLDLLSTTIILDSLVIHLPLHTLSRISLLSRSYRNLVASSPRIFKYLDLSNSRKAHVSPNLTRIDGGGNTRRAERMDESLTEDEFYAGPLKGVISTLQRLNIMPSVQVLVLDGLSSVTNDLIEEIVTRSDWNVRLLSIRKCPNVDSFHLQQLLRHICRPDRPKGSPRLVGLYFFTEPITSRNQQQDTLSTHGITAADGATLGTVPVDKSRESADQDPWYSPSGQIISTGQIDLTAWGETLVACKDIIAFDAVLCTHMHKAMNHSFNYASARSHPSRPGVPPLATMALGPEGCSGCGSAPSGAPEWGVSDMSEFPLLWQPPRTARIVDAFRPPPYPNGKDKSSSMRQRLIVSCKSCVSNRHCNSCKRWWCVDCYNPKRPRRSPGLDPGALDPEPTNENAERFVIADSIMVLNGLCIKDCLVGELMSGAGSLGMWA